MKEILKLKRCYILALLPVAFVIILICDANEWIAEYVFARVIYRICAIPIGLVTRWLPFSLAEIGLYLLIVAAIVVPVWFIVHMVKGKGRRGIIGLKAALNILCAVSVVVFSFVTLCGTNYYRYSFEKYLPYQREASDKEQLYQLCIHLAGKVNEARANIESEDKQGVMALSYDSTYQFMREAEKVMDEFAKDYPAIQWSAGCAKPVLASHYMSYTDIVGIFIPFTMEANVNVDVVEYNTPSDTLHELAHLRGVMPEDEANYVAYLACVQSERPDFVYSGYMMAYIYATNQLYDEDVDKYMEVRDTLSDGVIRDLVANSLYWDQFETPVGDVISDVSTSVNDAYLQVNGQENGVKSYGMVVDLLLAEYKYNLSK
ncbi:MAG: DUF3810 domain-containing protein [Lachnospiraceae bacterium]|nr:DUF3810 domain-containing protein [Lachnospiraceae bacterium]